MVAKAKVRAMAITLISVAVLVIGAGIVFTSVGRPVAQGGLEEKLTAVLLLAVILTLANVLLVMYMTQIASSLLLRRPKLAVQVRNPQADGKPVLFARRENVIEIALFNSGGSAAKYVHAAFRWLGGQEVSLRGPDGAYLDRRFWSEGDGRVRFYTGGLEKVVLSGRHAVIAELHVSRPEAPVRLGYKVFCEDMDEIQGEIELPVRELD